MISEQAQADYQLNLVSKIKKQVSSALTNKTEYGTQTTLMGLDLKFQVMKPGGFKDLMFDINQDRFFEARAVQTDVA